jgi:hypothetical protein
MAGSDEQLIAALAAGLTHAKAGEAAAVSDRTVRRRLADPDFRARLRDAQDRALDEALGRLAGGAVAAVERLLLMLQPGVPHAVQLGAARAVLSNALRVNDGRLDELEARLRELEKGAA